MQGTAGSLPGVLRTSVYDEYGYDSGQPGAERNRGENQKSKR